MSLVTEWLQPIALVAAGIILEAGFWIVLSLLAAGLIHEFLDNERFRQVMRRSGRSSLLGALGLGFVLPTCSCGVIPLAVSLYLNGTRLAAVMTFAAATPVINPAAVVLAYALLGPELTIAYVAFGLTAPLLVGLMAERWGQTQLTPVAAQLQSCCSASPRDAKLGAGALPAVSTTTAATRPWRAIKWGFGELGPTLGLYIGIGALLAGIVVVAIPPDWIATYLGGSAPFTSLLLVALFGASIYVCAVAHIPLVATFLAGGAGPGAAIVFLVTGAASNLPEFVALQRVLGTRTVLVYVFGLIGTSLLAGWLVNVWLAPGFDPVVSDPIERMKWLDLGSRITPVIPAPVGVVSAVGVFLLIAWGFVRWAVALPPRLRGRAAG